MTSVNQRDLSLFIQSSILKFKVAYFILRIIFGWLCPLILHDTVNSLHGVWPAAPQAVVQSSHVKLELDEAQIVDDLFVETSVAARHWWKHLSLREEIKMKTIYTNQVINWSVDLGNMQLLCDLRDLYVSTSWWPQFASLSRHQRFNQTLQRSSAVFSFL